MNVSALIRAWENPRSRHSLSALPESPVGYIELTEDELTEVTGAAQSGASVGCNTKTCVTSRGNSRNPCNPC